MGLMTRRKDWGALSRGAFFFVESIGIQGASRASR